jgi:hypothetical protein
MNPAKAVIGAGITSINEPVDPARKREQKTKPQAAEPAVLINPLQNTCTIPFLTA